MSFNTHVSLLRTQQIIFTTKLSRNGGGRGKKKKKINKFSTFCKRIIVQRLRNRKYIVYHKMFATTSNTRVQQSLSRASYRCLGVTPSCSGSSNTALMKRYMYHKFSHAFQFPFFMRSAISFVTI